MKGHRIDLWLLILGATGQGPDATAPGSPPLPGPGPGPAAPGPWPLAPAPFGATPAGNGIRSAALDWNGSIFTLISLRSFSSIWFWIVVAVTWSATTHNPLGVPFDMVLRARRRGGDDQTDLEAMVDIQLRRRQAILGSAGPVIVAVWATAVSALAVLGFGYGMELPQALTLLMVPLTVVGVLRMRLMAQLADRAVQGEELCRRLTWHRAGVQAIGLLAILLTALWGMWFNLNIRAVGG